jgi:hypothetical protein
LDKLKKPKYMKLFAAYQITETFDFMEGTDEEGFPRANLSRPVLPRLLSSFLQHTPANSTEALTTYGRLNARSQVHVEYSTTGTSNWQRTDINDGFKIDADGTLWFMGLRSLLKTYGTPSVTLSGGSVTLVTIPANALRMTLAIPTDHRLTRGAQLTADKSASSGFVKLGIADADEAQIDSSLSRTFYADAGQLYTKEIVADPSWPEPESITNSVQAEAGVIRDDSEYADAAALRRLNDIGRMARTGRLITPHIECTARPGQAIDCLVNRGHSGDFPIRGVVQTVIYSNDGKRQYTEREIA